MKEELRFETRAVHAGRKADAATGAVAQPIYLSTTFEREADGSFPSGYIYSRSANPNRAALEACLCSLEGGAAAIAFASGSAATMSVFQALAPGAHVIAPEDVYYGTKLQLQDLFARWGLEASFLDLSDLDAVQAALRPNTQLVWIETPSNPLMKITDIAAVSAIAHQAGARVIVDSTWATPLLQSPFLLGADLILHSSTKYLGGHSDVLGGVLVANAEDEFTARIRTLQGAGGAVPSPFDCWLVLRGIQTLPWRMRAHSDNAARVAAYLHGHPRVERVFYPGLADHPGHEVAARQMKGFGGMLSVQIAGGAEAAMNVAANVQIFTRATSLGGTESLLEHRASIEGPHSQTPRNLLRVSVGLEHADDLIADLEQALG
ncbi:cystathionine gamma-synthase [Tumebacillus sp. BK434]|uniref:trans-sulfuration enzyme family protein n=1 Tax=Tumebacillus sp. BK434 TaxID=2512169 RepID=UPI0010DBF655|nr:aminotransferase class V-fold PLP-dependent enzyme [Tumebacillus sp. BK434]TCP52529.1 cystathionine gamma-synthase [Tumebacillus sp. BK434]